jgi:hypothetical protein
MRDGLTLVLVGVEWVAPGYVKFINPYDPSRAIRFEIVNGSASLEDVSRSSRGVIDVAEEGRKG